MTVEPTADDRPHDAGWRVADDPRLRPPPLRADVLARPRLLHRLSDLGDARIVAIVAPAGFGKTTLLAQWHAAERRPVAWVSLDRECADPTVLLDLIAASLRGALADSFGVDATPPSRHTLAATDVRRFAAAIHHSGDPFVLFIDDVHVIEGTAALDALATLIGYLPARAIVGLASRTTAGLPIARWRAGGLTVELDEHDLALETTESVEMVRRIDPSIQTDRARGLHTRTEGWPAALYLATRSEVARPRTPSGVADNGIETSRSAMAAVDDYLSAELVERFDERTRSFLLATAILDRLTGGLCDAVTGGTGSGDLLAHLATSHHLITSLDDEGRWYRVHGLLRGHLLHRLERDGTDVVILHRRAADWLAVAGQTDAAIEHLLIADDTTAAARLASGSALRVVRDGRIDTLDRWMTHFGVTDLEANPWLTATAAISSILRGDVRRGHDLAAVLDGAVPGGAPSDREGSAASAVVHALMAADGLDLAFQTVLAAADAEPRHSPWRPIALATAAGLAVVLDDGVEADRLLPQAAEEAAAQHASRAEQTALAFRSLRAGRDDAWLRAEAFARQAVTLTATGAQGEATSGLAFAVAARSAAHRGDIRAARGHLASLHGASVSLTSVVPWLSVTALVEGSRAYLALSDPSGARSLLRQADAIARSRPELPLLTDRVHALQARIRRLPPGLDGASTLTPAEIRVLLLLPTYLSVPEIADRLVVSSNTVRTQVQSIYGKLGASSRAEAIERAIDAGLLEPLPILAAT